MTTSTLCNGSIDHLVNLLHVNVARLLGFSNVGSERRPGGVLEAGVPISELCVGFSFAVELGQFEVDVLQGTLICGTFFFDPSGKFRWQE